MPLPTRTPLPAICKAYAEHIRTVKTPRSFRADTFYLREMFGPICPELENNAERKAREADKPLPPKPGPRIEADCLEDIATADIAAFLTAQVRVRGLAPKTANRHREIIRRLFNWSVQQRA